MMKQGTKRDCINESDFQTAELAFLNHGTDDGDHECRVVSALIHKCNCLAAELEAHLKYPGAETKYQSQVEFFVDKLLKK